jgi:RNA polymerase sigma-70 factor (ECF subfamily)
MVTADPLRKYLDAAAEGDDVAVEHLVRRTQPVVWRVCAALGSPGEVEDLVQETYLRAIRSLHAYRGDAPVQVWLLSIARRVCADDVRRRQRRRRLQDRLTAHCLPETQLPAQVVDDLLDGLAPDRREAFVLTQFAGLSYEEVAHVCGCPIGTIRSRVARARADLAKVVGRLEAR